MRILQLTSHLHVGGIAAHVVRLAEALTVRGHQVSVASGDGELAGVLAHGHIPHWPVPLKTSAEFSPQVAWAIWQLSRQLATHPVDLIHAHTRVGQVAAAWLSRRHRIPWVATWHGFYRRRLSRQWFPCVGELTIAISQPVASHLEQVFGLNPGRIRLIPHGIDLARFAGPMDSAAQHSARQRLGLASNGPVIGTMSRLVSAKGVDHLIEAFPTVRTRIPQACLLIVGDGAQRPQLEQRARELGIESAVRFAGSVTDPALMLSLMDVFVFLPSAEEGFGLTLLEAMASARPIVSVGRGPGALWVLENHRVGMVVPPDDPSRLGEAVSRIVEDPAYATRLGGEALAVVRSHYDEARMITQVEEVYEEVRGATVHDRPREASAR